jgi:hypothetical protein
MEHHDWPAGRGRARGHRAATSTDLGWGHDYLRAALTDPETRRRWVAEARVAALLRPAEGPAWRRRLAAALAALGRLTGRRTALAGDQGTMVAAKLPGAGGPANHAGR